LFGRQTPLGLVFEPLRARLAVWVRKDPSQKRSELARAKGSVDEIRSFEDLRHAEGEERGLDERTAADLDLDDVFRRIDRTASSAGQQWLYSRLRRPAREISTLEAFDELVSDLTSARARPDLVRRALARLRGTNAYLLPFLLFGSLPEQPGVYSLAPLLTLAAAGALVASFFAKSALFVLLAICVVNIVVRLAYRKRIAPVLHSLPALRTLIRTGLALSKPDGGLPEGPRARLSAVAEPLRPLLKTTSWLVFETEQADEMSRMLYEYANLVFLLDVDAFLFSLEFLRRKRADIRRLFEALGEIDGALSVAAFRGSLPAWCRPHFTSPGTALRIVGALHPLLAAPVANDLEVEGRGVLVTGSNMSGKTTFIKTVGVDALLGATLFTCPATSYEAPLLDVVSAIGRSESLADGTSYYLGEVRRVHELVRAAEDGRGRLFLLDELFRGTNTVERIAAGKAVLAHLGRGPHVTLVSTHDIELVPLLTDSHAPYHFRESVADGALVFDYRLRPGPSSTRNAIALLASAAFPERLVADALRTVEILEQGRGVK
jgi:DNA mismatch repair ATPase MutS